MSAWLRWVRRPRGLAAAAALVVSAPVAAAGDWTVGPGATLRSRQADFRFTLAGYAQEDFRSFENWTAGDDDTGTLRNDTQELRRLRIGFEAEWKRLYVELDVDPRADQVTHLKDCYADVDLHDAFVLRGGHFKLPVSREFLTSASKLDFMERSRLSDSLAPDRDWGVMAHGDLGKRMAYEAGLFRGDGRGRRVRAETTFAARLVVEPADRLEVGGSFSAGDVEANPDGPGLDPVPKGLSAESATGFEYFEPRFVDGSRLRWGADAAWTPGPFGVKAEVLQSREERKGQGANFDDLPDVVGTGWAVSATWLVTGERKRNTIEPRRRLPAGPGAIELGVRYEQLRFDDAGPDEGFAGVGNRARNIRPGEGTAFTAGLSWWPVYWVRLMGNLVVEEFEDPLLAPEPGRAGNYVTLLGRVQVGIP